MNEDTLNMSVRKFLKTVGVTSQREIEKAVRAAAKSGRVPAGGRLKAQTRLSVPEIGLDTVIEGVIEVG